MTLSEGQSGEPVSPAAAKKVVEYIRSEYFVRLSENDPLIEAVVRDPDAGLRALLAAKHKAASEARIAKQIQGIRGIVRTVAAVEQETPAALTDRLIGKVETGYAEFSRGLSQKMDATDRIPPASWLRAHMEAPAKIIDINKENALRNHHRFAAAAQGSHGRLEDPYHFFYLVADRRDTAAGFSPMSRVMELSKDLDPANTVDMLLVGHEAKHVQLDAQKRMRIQSQEMFETYAAFFRGTRGERPRMDIAEELYTFAWEIEAANLVVDDRLRTAAIGDARTLLRALNGRPDQEGICSMILDLSRSYYPLGMRQNEAFPHGYTQAVAAKYERLYELYSMDPQTLEWARWR